MRKLNKTTGEIVSIKVDGLWSHFPIPAYRLLANKNEFAAQRILLCLVSHLGGVNGPYVFPTYKQIQQESGINVKRIREALNVLEDMGLVVVYSNHRGIDGKWPNNKYLIKMACWDVAQMNELALRWVPKSHKCVECGKLLTKGQFGDEGGTYKPHWGCGGQVVPRRSRRKIA